MDDSSCDLLGMTTVCEGDASEALCASASCIKLAAFDIETTGLDWAKDSIQTCQVYVPGEGLELIRVGDSPPSRIIDLVTATEVRSIFHHALFDLRFMMHHWDAKASNVACTKVASKLLVPERKIHSLQFLLQEVLGITIPKGQATSDWGAKELSKDQLRYAASDVFYLPALLEAIEARLQETNLLDLAHRCFEHIPARVMLDVGHYGDIFTY